MEPLYPGNLWGWNEDYRQFLVESLHTMNPTFTEEQRNALDEDKVDKMFLTLAERKRVQKIEKEKSDKNALSQLREMQQYFHLLVALFISFLCLYCFAFYLWPKYALLYFAVYVMYFTRSFLLFLYDIEKRNTVSYYYFELIFNPFGKNELNLNSNNGGLFIDAAFCQVDWKSIFRRISSYPRVGLIDPQNASVWKFILIAHAASKSFALWWFLLGSTIRYFGVDFTFDHSAGPFVSLICEWLVNISFFAFFSSSMKRLYGTETEMRNSLQDRELWYWIWCYVALDWSTFGLPNLVELFGVLLIFLYFYFLYWHGWTLALDNPHKFEDISKILAALTPFFCFSILLPAMPWLRDSLSNIVGTVMSLVTLWLLCPNTKALICETPFFYDEFEDRSNSKIVTSLEVYAQTFMNEFQSQDFQSLPLFYQFFLPLCLKVRSILLVFDVLSRIPTKLVFLHGYIVVVLLFLALSYCMGALLNIASFGYYLIPLPICAAGYLWMIRSLPSDAPKVATPDESEPEEEIGTESKKEI